MSWPFSQDFIGEIANIKLIFYNIMEKPII